LVSLTQIQEVPPKSMILLVGPPGAGKSTFCQQAILQNLAVDSPIIYVTTECGPFEAVKDFRERGLGEVEPGLLNFVDAYNETVGLSVSDRPDTVRADCGSLSSLSIAISKVQNRIGKKGVLLVFDSLTSPYLLSGPEVVRFLRLTLSRFAAEGNSVLACFDEGSGKEEDLVAMMSISNGVVKMEIKEGKRVLNVVKHPKVEPTRIEVTTTEIWEKIYDTKIWDREMMRRFITFFMEAAQSRAFKREFGQFAVNIFWPNFARWSCMLWDPKRFPKMTYEVWKEYIASSFRESIPLFPWYRRLPLKFLSKSLSRVKDMKKLLKLMNQQFMRSRRYGILEYLEDVSKTDEHYIRVYESYECWGFENVGAAVASYLPPAMAGHLKGLENWKGFERDWNAVETKCIGLGDSYCEFKLVPGEIDELNDSLEAIDNTIIERIYERLMDRLMGFLLDGKPLVERPTLGSDFYESPEMVLPAISERYQIAFRMGGARAGKKVGEHLIDAGIREDEAVKRILGFLEHCKVGKVTANGTIRMKDNCESIWTKFYTTRWEEPSCFFTTAFLNGFFSVVKNQHVKETKCIAMGDPYCEWEFR
jgi:predicted hydrocarbon binding protein/KaiC/GvpD/RAD55 family RecA-like ATPase